MTRRGSTAAAAALGIAIGAAGWIAAAQQAAYAEGLTCPGEPVTATRLALGQEVYAATPTTTPVFCPLPRVSDSRATRQQCISLHFRLVLYGWPISAPGSQHLHFQPMEHQGNNTGNENVEYGQQDERLVDDERVGPHPG